MGRSEVSIWLVSKASQKSGVLRASHPRKPHKWIVTVKNSWRIGINLGDGRSSIDNEIALPASPNHLMGAGADAG